MNEILKKNALKYYSGRNKIEDLYELAKNKDPDNPIFTRKLVQGMVKLDDKKLFDVKVSDAISYLQTLDPEIVMQITLYGITPDTRYLYYTKSEWETDEEVGKRIGRYLTQIDLNMQKESKQEQETIDKIHKLENEICMLKNQLKSIKRR